MLKSLREALRNRSRTQRMMLLGGLCIALAAFWMIGRALEQQETVKEDALKILTDDADVHIQNAHYTEVTDSGTIWEIDAESVRFVRKDNLAYFDKVRIKLTMKDGQSYVMRGDKGLLHTDTRNAELQGDVNVTSSTGWRFDTAALKYSDADHVIRADRDVKLQSSTLEIQGVGMSVHLNTEEVRLSSRVNAVLR
ncbi:MAG TPA: LPS export ABC transporter periplasmic protein LptC [Syntrophales bacterium]|nr:LPS export ABC transporter periplasmic protein LptC [Syntrophales bacterium]HPI55838.1 LPS export ABC transporter periplasmic protein LptC [Syntrophales bacterium]HPN23671.1 LPS export ABC transporter periplasmic protein LptC [Syntrophales bacterium]HQM27804.1 LPS export ABC transporter periplasmic protein LptC [Syntrophales bacterium]